MIFKPVRKCFHTQREKVHAASPAFRIPPGSSGSIVAFITRGLQACPRADVGSLPNATSPDQGLDNPMLSYSLNWSPNFSGCCSKMEYLQSVPLSISFLILGALGVKCPRYVIAWHLCKGTHTGTLSCFLLPTVITQPSHVSAPLYLRGVEWN